MFYIMFIWLSFNNINPYIQLKFLRLISYVNKWLYGEHKHIKTWLLWSRNKPQCFKYNTNNKCVNLFTYITYIKNAPLLHNDNINFYQMQDTHEKINIKISNDTSKYKINSVFLCVYNIFEFNLNIYFHICCMQK